MLDTIGTLFVIALWAVAIFVFVGSAIMCIAKLINGTGWEKCRVILAAILGVVAFSRVYSWVESIVWSLFATSFVIAAVSGILSNVEDQTPSRKEKYSFGDAIVDAYVEEKVIEEAVTNAIRKSKE